MIYLQIIKFSFLRFFAYPFEILAGIIKSILWMFFLIFFWSVVIKSMNGSVNITSIVSYFLIATGVKDIIMSDYGAFGHFLRELIRSGNLNNYLLKPAKIIPVVYSSVLGREGIAMFASVISIILGIIIQPPAGILGILLFLIFLTGSVIISFAVNLFRGSIYIHSADASGFDNVINHIIQVLSGAMIPLYFFPTAAADILRLTPFPAMVFNPVNALRITNITEEVLVSFGLTIFWCIFLNIGAYKFWRFSLKKYEAVGI